jgi:hypothetical protein
LDAQDVLASGPTAGRRAHSAARDDKSHKLWTDDYLAAFAQASAATLTTLDRKMPARYPSVRVELLLP